jgi:hypothetical protein
MQKKCSLESLEMARDERSDHPFTKRSGDMVYTSVLD